MQSNTKLTFDVLITISLYLHNFVVLRRSDGVSAVHFQTQNIRKPLFDGMIFPLLLYSYIRRMELSCLIRNLEYQITNACQISSFSCSSFENMSTTSHPMNSCQSLYSCKVMVLDISANGTQTQGAWISKRICFFWNFLWAVSKQILCDLNLQTSKKCLYWNGVLVLQMGQNPPYQLNWWYSILIFNHGLSNFGQQYICNCSRCDCLNAGYG